jgi:hypothetical protein
VGAFRLRPLLLLLLLLHLHKTLAIKNIEESLPDLGSLTLIMNTRRVRFKLGKHQCMECKQNEKDQ